MNRNHANIISERITNKQLVDMLEAAKEGITDWTQKSRVNKGITLGCSWNILANDFDPTKKHNNIFKINLIWDFGDFLPEHLKVPKKIKVTLKPPVHQEPKFK